MSDRYDPKLSVRPLNERKGGDPSAEEDPLAELARIVSGRATFDATAQAKGKPAPAPARADGDVGRDLEAELLNDLQASFAAIREPLEDATSAAAAAAPEPQPEIQPVLPPLRAAERKPEPPAPPRPVPHNFDLSPAFEEAELLPSPPPKSVRPEPVRPPAPPQARPAPPARGEAPVRNLPPPRPPAPPARGEPPAATKAEAPAQPRLDRPVPPAMDPGRPSLLRRVVGPPRRDNANLPVRPVSPADLPRNLETAASAPRIAPPRRERGDDAGPPSRFAPPRPAPGRPELASEPELEAAPDSAFELPELADDADGPFEDDFTLDDLDTTAYGDDLPPFPEDELASLKRRRSGRALTVIAGMLAIVVIGGAAVFLFRGDNGANTPPPIIAADAGPTKVAPDAPAASDNDADPQGKLIYDRVDEGDAAGSNDTKLVTSGDAPVEDIPPDDTADNAISRVIIPGGPGIDPPMANEDNQNGEAVIAEAGDGTNADSGTPAIGPRMVRTVVVKPDGTIVSSEATGVDENGNAAPADGATADADVPAADAAAPADTSTRTQMDSVLEGADLPVDTDPLSDSQPADADADSATAEAGTVPADEAIPDPPAGDATPAPVAELPTPTPETVPTKPAPTKPPATAAAPAPARTAPAPARQQQTIVATTGSADGPIDLTPGKAAPARSGPAPTGGGVVVQVSAQKSEEAAQSAYRSLQQRFPSILGAYQAHIVKADLGDKGVYYRVRVGPFAGGDAQRLCADLKAAGADCLLAR